MKNESEQVQRWDDIIFEKRNKEYGAYAIRKSYNNSVLKAEAISIGIGILIFVVPILLPGKKIPPTVFEKPDKDIVLEDYRIHVDPPPTPQPFRRMDASIIPTHVTTEPVIDEPPVDPDTDEVTYTTGPDNGTSTATGTDVFVGTGTEPAVEPPKPEFYLSPEVSPEYEGGYQAMMQFLQRKLHYPSKARSHQIEGPVYVSFIISATGEITRVEVIKGIGYGCDEEAVRVISMMNKWKPGMMNKLPVAVKMVLPIKFVLGS